MKKLFLSLAAAAMLLGLYSCDRQTVEPVSENETLSYDDPAFVISEEGLDAENQAITDLTLDSDANVNFEEPAEAFRPPQRPPKRGPRMDMRFILRKLDLTEQQFESVKVIMIDFHKCQWNIRRAFFANIKPKLDNVNTLRREIIQKMRDGEITRQQAIRQLRELNKRFREATRPMHERFMQAVKNCHESMISSILEILDEEQKAMFIQWLRKYHPRH